MKSAWLSRQEKLQWNRDGIEASSKEKEMAYCKSLRRSTGNAMPSFIFRRRKMWKYRRLNMALEIIERLSGSINHQVGGRLRERTSQILSEITGGKYTEVLMDAEL